MKASILFREKVTDGEGNLIELVVWRVPVDWKYLEGVKYRMVFIPDQWSKPAVLYDNHYPKGHHRHLVGKEMKYHFKSIQQLRADFESDIRNFKDRGK